jgi:hypothetical protein
MAITNIEPGAIVFRSVFVDNRDETQVSLDYYHVFDKEHLDETILHIHNNLKEYYPGAKEIRTTWRYDKK